ncbi:MAG: hypothetical protein JXQ75_02930 [Phycisphaerae bacterium]|nr:hypothetical protein [Phycisphaerae bacterium]
MTAKKSNCVELKHEIQQGILKEIGGTSPQEQRRRMEEDILSDPVLGPIWRRARRIPQSAPVARGPCGE